MEECSKCHLKLMLRKCPQSATAHVKIQTDGDMEKGVTLFRKEIGIIIAEVSGKDLADKLLNAPGVKLYINAGGIVTSASIP